MIQLSISSLHHFLISRRLLRAEDVISARYSVVQYDHRAKIFIVNKGNEEGLFVKQLKEDMSPLPFLLQKDATTLWNIKNVSVFQKLLPFTATYLGYDVDHQALITEYDIGYVNVEQALSEGRVVNHELLSEVIELLGLVHIPFSKPPETPSVYFYPRSTPWIFQILSYDENGRVLLPHYTPISQDVAGHLAVKDALSIAMNEWEIESFIHGDIKWTNFLIASDSAQSDVKLIDWEMADLGDPVWDIAGLVHCVIKDGILKRDEAIIDMFGDVTSSLSFDWVCHIIKQYNTHRVISKHEPLSIAKLIRYSMIRLLQSACELNDFDMQLKPVTIHVLDTAKYIADYFDDIVSLIKDKIEEV